MELNETLEGSEEQDTPEARKAEDFARDLLAEVTEREEFFSSGKGWWSAGDKAVDIYEGKKCEDTPYNILYSNTEVLLPSLFSAVPKPDVRPRHKGMKLGEIPEIIDRFILTAVDPGHPGEEDFFSAVSDATVSGLTAGAGFVRSSGGR